MKNYTLCSLLFETSKDYEKNLQTLLTNIKQTPANSLIVAGEVCLTGYDYDNFEKMVEFSSYATEVIKQHSQNKIIILTMLEKKDGKVYNFAKIFHNGEVVYTQPKAKLFKFGDEHKYMEAGDSKSFKIVEVDGIKIAILICFELRFKELWIQNEGADVIAVPSYWGVLRTQHFITLTNALAIMNQCYVVASDSADEECTKQSGIILPNGEESRNDNLENLQLPYLKKEIQKMRRYMDVGIDG